MKKSHPLKSSRIDSTEKKTLKIPNPKLKKLHSLSSLQRSNSRLENEENIPNNCQANTTNEIKPPKDSYLFLSFSKLVALESNLQKPAEATQNEKPEFIKTAAQKRPRTAHAKLEMSTVNLNNLDQDSHKKPANTPIIERHVIDKPDGAALGNQDDYQNIFQDEFVHEQAAVDEPNWLHLPDEIWLNILGYLNQNELAQFGLTCKKFQKLYVDGTLCNLFKQIRPSKFLFTFV